MKIMVRVNGHDIELLLDKIKECARFSIYQVSQLVNGEKVPLYKECFSDFDICKIIENNYRYNMESTDETVDILGLLG